MCTLLLVLWHSWAGLSVCLRLSENTPESLLGGRDVRSMQSMRHVEGFGSVPDDATRS